MMNPYLVQSCKSKKDPKSDKYSGLGKNHCNNLQDESEHTSKISSIDNDYTKPGHTDCNNSANGSFMFIKVFLKDSSVVDFEDKNESDMSNIKIFVYKFQRSILFPITHL